MTSVRTRTCAAGAAVAVTAGVLVDHGSALGDDLPATAVLGVAAGAVVALVPHRSAPERAGAFLAGFLAAWLGYALRAGVLPDIPMGRALAAVIVLSIVTAVATATADRLPLWGGLVGVATLVGAYEVIYTATPAEFGPESAVAATSVLLSAAVAFVVMTLVAAALEAGPDGAGHRPVRHADTAEQADEADQYSSLGDLMSPAGSRTATADTASYDAPRTASSDAPPPDATTPTTPSSESER